MADQPSQQSVSLGISSCLLGDHVRHDGGHKRDRFITGTRSTYFRFVPVCPELAIGLGVPRDPIQLRGRPGAIRVVGVIDPDLDVTERLRECGARTARALTDISGYIFKSRSPSCGMERVKLFTDNAAAAPTCDGVGQYAHAFMQQQPLLPVEEDGRLNDPSLRENFIERVFTYRRWQDLCRAGITPRALIEFHTRHKLAVLAHSQSGYAELGRLIAGAGDRSIRDLAHEYIATLMATLQRPATRKNHTNVLQHVQGYLKAQLDAADKAELVELIDRFRHGQVPLVVPVTLLNHHFRRHPDPYMAKQIYLRPHPPELMLRNLI